MIKKIVLVLSGCCIFAGLSWSIDHGDGVFIPIHVYENTVITGRTHRAPVNIPFRAIYDDSTRSIFITFLQDLGEINIDIINLSNSFFVTQSVDTAQDTVIIPISGDEGYYRILFSFSSGLVYEGNFIL